MAGLQTDAVSAFIHLTEQVPSWLIQLADLTKHAAQKNSEFVAEYTTLVNKAKQRRIKSPSLQSIHSDHSKSARIPAIDPRTDPGLPAPPDPVDIDPLQAGNKYLYAQAHRKRKPTSSVRSGVSGPQRFRSKNQVVIYYDSHIQLELDSMFKAIGVARNYLRKGRNAHSASQGFPLPMFGKKAGMPVTPSLDSLRAHSMSRTNPILTASKYSLRSSTQQSSNGDDTLFASADKALEAVQGLYETAAHQFLRDGDCKAELESAVSQLNTVYAEAKQAVQTLRKVEKQKEESAEAESNATDTTSDISQRTPPNAFDPLRATTSKYGPISHSQTLGDMQQRAPLSRPDLGDLSNLPKDGDTIEVDDDTDEGSIDPIDMSQFRAVNRVRMGRV